MKRRKFLKMIPIGILAAKFGGLVDLVRPKIVNVPFKITVLGATSEDIENFPIMKGQALIVNSETLGNYEGVVESVTYV